MADRGLQARARRALAALTASGGAQLATLSRGITCSSAEVGSAAPGHKMGKVVLSHNRDLSLFDMCYRECKPLPSHLVGRRDPDSEGAMRYRVVRAAVPFYNALELTVQHYGRKGGEWHERIRGAGYLCARCLDADAVSKAGWRTVVRRPGVRRSEWARCGACGDARRTGAFPYPAARRAAAAAALGRRGELAAAYAAGTPPARPAF